MEKKCDYNQEEEIEKTEFHTLEKWERRNENYMEDNRKRECRGKKTKNK